MNKIDIILDFLQIKNNYTYNHSLQVGELSCEIAENMSLPYKKIEDIRKGGLLHDIGKIYVPNEILMKPTRLTQIEMELLKEHSLNGYNLLKKYGFNKQIITYVLQHQERLDGTGYPQGLKKDEILLGSKIISVADTISAMLSDRPYRARLELKEVENYLYSNQNLFNKEIVKIAFEIISDDILDKKLLVI